MRRCLLLFVSIHLWSLGFTQSICEGNLGNNIFDGGDFGSGVQNVLPQDPQIAPGYIYTLSPPPDDGLYTITNNTGAWPNLYPAWIATGDNSSDPNGYMMVVNASFSPGIFYEETITGLCESTFYEFSADIINLIIPGTPDHIDPNVDFLIDGQVVYSTGVIPKTGEWTKYGFTFETDGTQSEITLTLRNNAPGGIGNDLALDNISFRPCGPKSFIDLDSEETIFLCVEGQPLSIIADIVAATGQEFSLFWEESQDGDNWTKSGIVNEDTIMHDIFDPGDYYYRYISAADDINLDNDKCRIISDVIHIQVLPRFYDFQDTLCVGGRYDFNGTELSSGGIYVDTLISSFGCDSVITLTLEEVPDIPIEAELMTLDPSCFNFNDGMINLDGVTGGYGGYSYSLDGMDTNTSISGLASGDYILEIHDRFGCNATFDVNLINPEPFTVSIGEDQSVILGEEIQVNVNSSYDIVSWQWFPGSYFSCQNCPDPVVFPTESGYVSLTAFNENDCITVDSFFVNVARDKAVFIPNVFSPNEDGNNDRFEVKAFGNSVRSIVSFQIFNRWGNLVYNKENLLLGDIQGFWDGKVNDKYVPQGVYTYLIEVEYLDEIKEIITGDVTIIR